MITVQYVLINPTRNGTKPVRAYDAQVEVYLEEKHEADLHYWCAQFGYQVKVLGNGNLCINKQVDDEKLPNDADDKMFNWIIKLLEQLRDEQNATA